MVRKMKQELRERNLERAVAFICMTVLEVLLCVLLLC